MIEEVNTLKIVLSCLLFLFSSSFFVVIVVIGFLCFITIYYVLALLVDFSYIQYLFTLLASNTTT